MNLEYRSFRHLGLKGDVTDHSTFSENRHGRFLDHDTYASCSIQCFDAV